MAMSAADFSAIQETVEHYFQGMYQGDTAELRKAFHPSAQVIGHFQGRFVLNSLEQFLGVVASAPVPARKGETYDMGVVSVDVTGETAAAVKVTDLYQGLRFTDYLSLLKVDGAWVIVNKTFYHAPKT
jgi:protease I